MNTSSFKVILCVIVLAFFSQLSFAAPGSTQVMAEILVGLNHYPSDEQKKTLEAISNNESSSDAEKVIALAIYNMQHQAKPDDVVALKKIANDEKATEAEKTLANIVIGINHKPDEAAKSKLQAIAK